MTQSLAPIVFDKTSAPSGDSPLWLYCVIPAGQALPRAPGVDLFGVERGSLVAVVEAVRFAGIAPELLGASLNSIELVEPLARRREQLRRL